MKTFRIILLCFLILTVGGFIFFFVGNPPQQKEIIFGVNFSQKHAQNLGLNWKETFSALLDDLGVKEIKLATYWDLIEKEREKYDFEDLDWQIQTAEEKDARLLLVIGMKTPRWPECHIPDWAKELNKEDQQREILNLLERIVLRYKDKNSITMWQVENEPFFSFGECPWTDKEFLEKEVALVKTLDDKKPVLISDSGEGSLWIQAAKIGDIVGTTLYRKVWFKEIKSYFSYPFTPMFYWRKAEIINRLFKKEVICVELQAEPWCPQLIYDCPINEQEKTMILDRFQESIDFAQKTGFKKFYLWGAEWWYWMKEKQNKPEIWLEAKKLF